MILVIITCYAEERVDLSVFSPACLPGNGETFVNQNGLVYGEQDIVEKVLFTLFQVGEPLESRTPQQTSCRRPWSR